MHCFKCEEPISGGNICRKCEIKSILLDTQLSIDNQQAMIEIISERIKKAKECLEYLLKELD